MDSYSQISRLRSDMYEERRRHREELQELGQRVFELEMRPLVAMSYIIPALGFAIAVLIALGHG